MVAARTLDPLHLVARQLHPAIAHPHTHELEVGVSLVLADPRFTPPRNSDRTSTSSIPQAHSFGGRVVPITAHQPDLLGSTGVSMGEQVGRGSMGLACVDSLHYSLDQRQEVIPTIALANTELSHNFNYLACSGDFYPALTHGATCISAMIADEQISTSLGDSVGSSFLDRPKVLDEQRQYGCRLPPCLSESFPLDHRRTFQRSQLNPFILGSGTSPPRASNVSISTSPHPDSPPLVRSVSEGFSYLTSSFPHTQAFLSRGCQNDAHFPSSSGDKAFLRNLSSESRQWQYPALHSGLVQHLPTEVIAPGRAVDMHHGGSMHDGPMSQSNMSPYRNSLIRSHSRLMPTTESSEMDSSDFPRYFPMYSPMSDYAAFHTQFDSTGSYSVTPSSPTGSARPPSMTMEIDSPVSTQLASPLIPSRDLGFDPLLKSADCVGRIDHPTCLQEPPSYLPVLDHVGGCFLDSTPDEPRPSDISDGNRVSLRNSGRSKGKRDAAVGRRKPSSKPCHECEVCHQTFTLKKDRNRHAEIHAGRKYPCPICGKDAARKDGLLRHLRNIHRQRPA